MKFLLYTPLIIWDIGFIILNLMQVPGTSLWDLFYQLIVSSIFIYPYKNNTGTINDRFGTSILLTIIRFTFSGINFGLLYLTKRNLSYIAFSVIILGMTLYKNLRELSAYEIRYQTNCTELFFRKYLAGCYISFFTAFLGIGFFSFYSVHLFLLMTSVFLFNFINFTLVPINAINTINEERVENNKKTLIILCNFISAILECPMCIYFFMEIHITIGKIFMAIMSIFFFENFISSIFLYFAIEKIENEENRINQNYFVIITPDDIQIGEKLYKS